MYETRGFGNLQDTKSTTGICRVAAFLNTRWSGLLGAAFLESVATMELYYRKLSLVEPQYPPLRSGSPSTQH